MATQTQAILTPEQYLELERESEIRHEFYQGRMYAMSGGTYNHSRIIGNFFVEIHLALRGTACRALMGDMRVRVAPEGLYTYPDIAVVCGDPALADKRNDTLLNPALLIEVLSPSTEAYDRGFKATQYRKLASLKEYALVSQREQRVEVFTRQPSGGWLLSEWAGAEAICHLASVERDIALAQIYDGILLESQASQPES